MGRDETGKTGFATGIRHTLSVGGQFATTSDLGSNRGIQDRVTLSQPTVSHFCPLHLRFANPPG